MILVIALGGALGTVARYGVSRLAYYLLGESFPYGTLIVNVAGSLLLGLLVTILIERVVANHDLRAFIQIGLLGGFTTFSSFSYETLALYQQGQLLIAILNVVLNVILCLLAVALGTQLARLI